MRTERPASSAAPPPADAPQDARAVVDRVLNNAITGGASDVHVEPVQGGYEVRYRIDGLLRPAMALDAATGRAAVGRLMVLANLLTYRLDIPQEGRLAFTPNAAQAAPTPRRALDLRLAIMPTALGLRAAVRLPAELSQPHTLEQLGLPGQALEGLRRFAGADQGMLIVTGPAGSGKTTTLYALLRHIAGTSAGLSIITLEDPVERHLPGVTQIEVKPFGELTYERALRSLLRQDPQVLMLGEIRDAATASLALQAALSGHRLLCTLHAATPGGAIARLLEMGMEPYQITSSLFGVVAQRLLRRRTSNTGPASEPQYAGRAPAAEFVAMTPPLRQAILSGADADTLGALVAAQQRHVTLRAAAEAMVEQGMTDAAEVARVLGGPSSGAAGSPQ